MARKYRIRNIRVDNRRASFVFNYSVLLPPPFVVPPNRTAPGFPTKVRKNSRSSKEKIGKIWVHPRRVYNTAGMEFWFLFFFDGRFYFYLHFFFELRLNARTLRRADNNFNVDAAYRITR